MSLMLVFNMWIVYTVHSRLAIAICESFAQQKILWKKILYTVVFVCIGCNIALFKFGHSAI